jgi:DNA-binding IscR family transcriptional regulator
MSASGVHAAWLRVNEAMLDCCREIRLSELVAKTEEDEGADWVI